MKRRQNKKFLSVVVPAYKQEKTIKKDLKTIDETLKKGLQKNYRYEIICIVDGLVDNTFKEAKKVSSRKIKIFFYKENRGKGYAV